MGYSPKHAKPVSFRGTALKTPLSGGASNGPGRHRAGARIPAPRIAGDESVPAGPGPNAVPDPVTAPGTSEETAPAAGIGTGAGHAEEAIASETRSGDRPADKQAARAEVLMRLIPPQRTPIPES